MPEQLPAELVELRARIQRFIDEELRPLEASLDRGAEEGDVSASLRQEVRQRSRAAGIFGLTQPRDLGGLEAGPLALTVARETVAAGNLVLGHFVFGPGPGLLRGVEGRLRDEYLEPLLDGRKAAGFGFTEPSGPDAGKPTYAVRDGDDLLITGRKSYVSNGPFCDFFEVLVNVEPSGDQPAGLAMVLVDRDTPGLTLPREFTTLDGSRHAEVALDAARVPITNVVGRIGGGMNRALGQIGEMRLMVSASACGTALWTTEYVRAHIMQPHRQGGALADREGVRRIFADLLIDTYAARSVLYRTARLAEAGEDVMNEGSLAKVFATEAAGRVVDQAVQLVGGNALIHGHPLERLYRQVRSLRIAEGASDLLRLNIARGLIEFNAGRV